MSEELSTSPYKLYRVKNGVITYNFQGLVLASSSSRVANRPRWVEFELYVTPKNQYVISRIGMSVFYHAKSCETATRNNLAAVDGAELAGYYIPCPECRPSRMDYEGVYPELPRYWAAQCEDADGVVEALMKKDDFNNWYLTHVAKRLLEDAGKYDPKIDSAFREQTIE